MPPATSTSDRIAALKTEIASLEQSAVQELTARRDDLTAELARVDADIALLSGEPVEKSKREGRPPKPARKQISFELLKTMLREFPGRTMNIRKERYDARQIKSLATAHPESLTIGGKGPWPTVTLVK